MSTSDYPTTINGRLVRYWSVYLQRWQELDASCIPNEDLAALSADERAKIAEAARATA